MTKPGGRGLGAGPVPLGGANNPGAVVVKTGGSGPNPLGRANQSQSMVIKGGKPMAGMAPTEGLTAYVPPNPLDYAPGNPQGSRN